MRGVVPRAVKMWFSRNVDTGWSILLNKLLDHIPGTTILDEKSAHANGRTERALSLALEMSSDIIARAKWRLKPTWTLGDAYVL
jgi:hypothetical protein